MNGYDPHVAPPTRVQGAPSTLREAVVQTVNANGTVDLRAVDSRAGWTQVALPGWYTPTVGDHVIIADLQGDSQKAVVIAPLSPPISTTANPPGIMVAYAGASAPTGWLLCDGSAVSRTTYAALFAAIGTVHGAGDGSTTFNVPDMRGRVAVGVGTATGANGATFHTLGQQGGEETHILTQIEMPSHNHTYGLTSTTTKSLPLGSGQSITAVLNVGTNTTGFAGANNAHNNMQPYVGLNHIIKT